MENKIKQYFKQYLQRIKKIYGEIPQHCHETQVILGENPENHYASGADLEHNIIYLNPGDPDVEWTLYHEMEHIRTAHSINKTNYTGAYMDMGEIVGKALTEAMTEISVENLLNRKQDKIGYFEIIQLTRQIATLLNMDDLELLKYYHKNGITELWQVCKNLNIRPKLLVDIIICLDNLNDSHIEDLDYEFSTYGKIENKPLGSFPSDKTKDLRFKFNSLKNELFDKIKENNCYNNATLYEVSHKFKSLSPYEEERVVKL